jgi:predicted DNA-binding transcriptional regulator AlpA
VALLSTKQVLARIGVPRSTWYEMRARGEFPAPVKVFDHAVAWRSEDIDRWCAANPTPDP